MQRYSIILTKPRKNMLNSTKILTTDDFEADSFVYKT